MRAIGFLVVICLGCAFTAASAEDPALPLNPAIDMAGYLRAARDAAAHREAHRLSEDEFIRMSDVPGVVVLDARSREKYTKLHVVGAINLSFPDLATSTLNAAIPDRATTILIYCNNNFLNAEDAFPSKVPNASLNLATYIALYTYGYRNVYELGPLIDIEESRLSFESGDSPGRN